MADEYQLTLAEGSQSTQRGVRTYSGSDITAFIYFPFESDSFRKLGNLKLFSWGFTRTKVAVGQLGYLQPIGHTRGLRIITGVLSFIQLDRNAFMPLSNTQYASRGGDMHIPVLQDRQADAHEVYRYVYLPDELPPFDLMLTYANEDGSLSYRIVQNIEIVQGQGTESMDDPELNETYAFIALGMTNLMPYNTGVNKNRLVNTRDQPVRGRGALPEYPTDHLWNPDYVPPQTRVQIGKPMRRGDGETSGVYKDATASQTMQQFSPVLRRTIQQIRNESDVLQVSQEPSSQFDVRPAQGIAGSFVLPPDV